MQSDFPSPALHTDAASGGVRNMLDLSTAHMPASTPDWGGLRVVEHEHGWVVFVPGREHCDDVPAWAVPFVKRALDLDCILVNFDRDAEPVEGLPVWEWQC